MDTFFSLLFYLTFPKCFSYNFYTASQSYTGRINHNSRYKTHAIITTFHFGNSAPDTEIIQGSCPSVAGVPKVRRYSIGCCNLKAFGCLGLNYKHVMKLSWECLGGVVGGSFGNGSTVQTTVRIWGAQRKGKIRTARRSPDRGSGVVLTPPTCPVSATKHYTVLNKLFHYPI